MEEEIRQFIVGTFPMARKKRPGRDDSLLESGMVDSLGVLEIVNYLVERHGIEIDEDDLMPENFDSVRSIANFVQRKRDGSGL
jgi:acyl carrier protein